MKTQVIYTIRPGYRQCKAWLCDNRTRRRMCELTSTPAPKFNRQQRYEAICRFLKNLKVPLPVYVPAGRGKV